MDLTLSDVAYPIVAGLWVSSMPQPDWDLEGWGIDLVVSLSDHLPPQAARRDEWGTRGEAIGAGAIAFVHWPIDDGLVPRGDLLELVTTTIVAGLDAGLRILVHCAEGRNRSMLVAGLVLHRRGVRGIDAVRQLQDLRGGVLGNRAFARYLIDLP